VTTTDGDDGGQQQDDDDMTVGYGMVVTSTGKEEKYSGTG